MMFTTSSWFVSMCTLDRINGYGQHCSNTSEASILTPRCHFVRRALGFYRGCWR